MATLLSAIVAKGAIKTDKTISNYKAGYPQRYNFWRLKDQHLKRTASKALVMN